MKWRNTVTFDLVGFLSSTLVTTLLCLVVSVEPLLLTETPTKQQQTQGQEEIIPTPESIYKRRLERACPKGLNNCPDVASYIELCSKKSPEKAAANIAYVDTTPWITPEAQLCRGSVFLLAGVHSGPGNFQRRQSIRQTWGSLRQVGQHRIQLAFFLGRSEDASLQAKVQEESERFRDIIQRDYKENYRNMTRKHMIVIEWIAEHCSHAHYLMKVDDDTFVDIFHVVQFLVSNPIEESFYCTATANAKPQRKPTGHLKKWTVTRAEYRPNKYPVYCEGLAYLMDAKLAPALLWCSTFTKLFWIDDVYVSGLLAEKLKIPRLRFWKGHSYTSILPSHASSTILDYLFLMAANNEFMPSVWNKLWKAVLVYSMDLYI